MPLNKLDNFIKNVEGRILYVNPDDLDSTVILTINEGWVSLLEALLITVYVSYFGSRGAEKIQKIRK